MKGLVGGPLLVGDLRPGPPAPWYAPASLPRIHPLYTVRHCSNTASYNNNNTSTVLPPSEDCIGLYFA